MPGSNRTLDLWKGCLLVVVGGVGVSQMHVRVSAVGGQHRAGHSLPSPSSRSISIPPPQISPPHQNTPNGKKIWHEEGGGRRRSVEPSRAPGWTWTGGPAGAAHVDRQQRRGSTKRSGDKAPVDAPRLLEQHSSSACARRRGGAQGPGGGRQPPPLHTHVTTEAGCWSRSSASSVPSAPAEEKARK